MRIVISLLFVFLMSIVAFAQQEAGIVLSVSGDVRLESAGVGANSSPATVKAIIYQDDVIITGEDGRVQVLFRDDTIMSLSPDTELALTDFDFSRTGSSFAANVAKGVARVVTGEIVKRNPENFNISTPHATIAIRGTTVTAIVQPEGTSTIINDATLGRPVLVTSIATNETVSSDQTGMALRAEASGAASVREATAEELRVSQQVSPSLPTDSEIAAVDSRSNLTDRVINNATNPEYLPEEFKPMTAELGVGEAVYKGSLSNGRWFPTHSGNFSFNVNMNSGLVTNFSANIERNGGSRGSLEVRQSGVMSIDNNGVFQSNPGDLEFRSESGRWGNSYSGANETNSSLRGEIGRRPDLDLDIRNNSNHSIVDLDGRGISCQGDCRR